jgi:hypothetical protein
MASNHTTFASLAMSPDGTRMESKLKDCKRQVRSRVKQIKQLEATISKLKSKSNEVNTKIPLEINGEPGAIQGILGKIMNQVKDESAGSSDETKRKKEVRDQIVMSLLNNSLNDEEKDSQYNMDEARMFVQGIREEIEKYAKRVTGKDKQALFRLMHQWIADGMNMVPKDVMPKIPSAMQVIDNGQVVVSVDTDSEVHRFVASGIKTYRTLATKRLKRLTRAAEEREKAQKAPQSSHHRDICTMKGATGLLNAMGMLRKDIPETHDKSYDSPVLEALNRGGASVCVTPMGKNVNDKGVSFCNSWSNSISGK